MLLLLLLHRHSLFMVSESESEFRWPGADGERVLLALSESSGGVNSL